jgi:hypothetical protein
MYNGRSRVGKLSCSAIFSLPVSPVAWRSTLATTVVADPLLQSPKRAALWRTLVPEDIERGG